MSTLLLTENFPPTIGGTSRWFWELYRRQPVSAIVIGAGACAGAEAFDRTHALRVTRLPLTFADRGILSIAGWRSYRRTAAALRALVRHADIRGAHCARVVPEGWLALQCRIPYACFVHGEELNTARTSRQLQWMACLSLCRSGRVFANARHTADILRNDWHVPAAKITVLHPGVDTSRFVPAAPDDGVRMSLGWAGRRVILTVARLQRRKGHDRMIEAVALLSRRFPDLLYAIVGDGEEREALATRVRRAGLERHVRFHGTLDDAWLLRAYQQCELFVLPNRTEAGDFEGFGMVLLEAQACGRAVIAGDSGGTVEAMQPDETGFIADCTRSDRLAAVIAVLLSDSVRCQQMGAAGRLWVERNFDFDATQATTARMLDIPLAA